MTRLTASDVVAGYGAVEILHGVSVEAGDGEVTCIFGPNGCGKSTLLGAIAGTVDVWAGEVDLDGEKLTGRPAHAVLKSGLALMPQGGGIFPQLSVRENPPIMFDVGQRGSSHVAALRRYVLEVLSHPA